QYYSSGNTYWLESTDYIRLKNVELGYNFPVEWTKRFGMNNLRLYTNGLNLFTISKMTAYDPESVTQTGQYYPQARVINFGASVTF
ncbi:TonB-dependent receptor, partial [Brucella sp. 21LCYQ03]|nr:TonB-dependent receptor [Brucella sp. 21LCYQ03]